MPGIKIFQGFETLNDGSHMAVLSETHVNVQGLYTIYIISWEPGRASFWKERMLAVVMGT